MKKIFIATILTMIFGQAIAGLKLDVVLVPNETKEIKNWFGMTISGKCKMETKEPVIALSLSIKGKGSIDGHKFHKGEVVQINAHNGESFSLTAEPSAILNITKVQAANMPSNNENAIAHCHM